MKKLFKKLVDSHRFFIIESRNFVNCRLIENRLYYPIAYLKFMCYSVRDYIRGAKEIIQKETALNE